MALRFRFVITLSGLLTFDAFRLPSDWQLMGPLVKAQEATETERPGPPHEPSGRAWNTCCDRRREEAAKACWAAQGVGADVGSVSITIGPASRAAGR